MDAGLKVLMEVSGQIHALAAFSWGETAMIPVEHESGRAPEPAWMAWENIKSLAPDKI
jgi:hypothetical protein